ncbi:SAICAR synthetase [Sistotremastrum niveocremeum HHB9708]|uniref:Phosphoribosylaminoimidazole-succinocarboxamide synthase n=1 Tax=Sistotremastrum niveocremeum HHB9708 TaxID=1314777 RepID=A0A164VWG3_9AGAM|nr:SAICAR synthetase [Sistotremastrum niveocremeum HHB9708]
MALLNSSLPGLALVSKGKVRDIYATSDLSTLLFVASDRISAYDVILRNGIPDKGKILTQLSLFWFNRLQHIIPNHVITADVHQMPPETHQYLEQLQGRSILVRKAEVIPLECIVRGYITGSAWSEYKKSGTCHGIELPAGLQESQKLDKPLFTPSTKAEQGQHDENIHPDKAAELIGSDLYEIISTTSVKLYSDAAEFALSRGLILADTKFEFGLLPQSPSNPTLQSRVILIDEALTPDSSRYWPAAEYEVGRSQKSFDKQHLRDWLVGQGFQKGRESGPPGKEGEGWTMDDVVVEGTKARYEEAMKLLTK